MLNKTLLIISIMLVSAGFVFLGSTEVGAQSQDETFVVTESSVENGLIKRQHNAFGVPVTSTFLYDGTYVSGIEADVWIVDGPINVSEIGTKVEAGFARKRLFSSEFFGEGNPTYSCGWTPCFFWP